ncbi:MAG: hypothetical protein EOP84_26890 [Verrucomicrobiaceae bacterium]|nr:MAG: hypothetical protein EOP84_26890 [Verrucomicrobiaceae bacterium]
MSLIRKQLKDGRRKVVEISFTRLERGPSAQAAMTNLPMRESSPSPLTGIPFQIRVQGNNGIALEWADISVSSRIWLDDARTPTAAMRKAFCRTND